MGEEVCTVQACFAMLGWYRLTSAWLLAASECLASGSASADCPGKRLVFEGARGYCEQVCTQSAPLSSACLPVVSLELSVALAVIGCVHSKALTISHCSNELRAGQQGVVSEDR